MSVAFERRRAARISDSIGALLIVIGAVGFISSVALTIWTIHDLDKFERGLGGTGAMTVVSKLQSVALIGVTPGMLSLLVLAFGVYLQTRSTELLFGTIVDSDPFGDEDDDGGDDGVAELS